ncbi:zinc finger protein [Ophiostoma piceae UAMH 11346]|uniref:Zinc finger protein n=1 Tax=Ophiostoma piceae (strain UAMH 11346) TaxID=1262450 RepID=S3CTD7_OPHP1|nr:zinc finger protein [Ophiostoma piceae UAMH 11346]
MSTVMEPKKFAFFMKDDSRSFISRDPYHFSRSNSPARFGPRRTTNSTARPLSPNDISCVALNTSKDDCATQRFILWAAVRRNACMQMGEEKRLECPLLRCQQRFPDHESMLRHLITCDMLPDCEYWCYEHMRVERFDDSRCKKCIGHPSKRRKMLTLAKSFFTSLGHNKGKAVVYQPPSSLSPAPTTNEPWASDSMSPASHNISDVNSECPSRSASNGSSNSGNTRYNSTRSTASNRSIASEATNYTSRSNSYRRGADVLDISARSSMSGSPTNGASFPPPPRYEDIGALIPSELHSNDVVAELEAPVVVAPVEISQRAPSASFASSQMQAARPQRPIMPDITGINDFLGDIAAMAPTYQNAAYIAPELSITPPPACPTPPVVLNTISTVDGSPSVDPAELRLSELDSFINWEPTMTTMPSAFGGIDVNSIAYQPYTGPDYHMVDASQDQVLSQEGNQSLQHSSSVRSTTSTNTTISTVSMNSIMSDGSGTSFLSNATSVSPASDGSHQWPASNQTKLTLPASNFDNLLANGWTATDPTMTEPTCDPLNSSFVTETPGMASIPGLTDMDMDLSLMYDFSLPIAPTPQTLGASADVTTSIPPVAPITTAAPVVSSTFPENVNDDASSHDHDESFQDLASSARDLLATHVITSFAKLADVDSSMNTLALSFQNASMRKIMDTGVDALKTALATGTEVMPAFDTLCFLHLVYSFSLGVHKSEAPFKSYALFYQSLEYSRNFTSIQDRDNYLEIVSLIWQPAGMTSFDLSETLRQCRNNTTRSPLFHSSLSANNVVAGTIKAFLDNLEMAAILDPEASSPAFSTAASETIKASSLLALHFGSFKNSTTCASLSEQERNILDTLLLGFPEFSELCNAPGLKLRLETIRHQLSNPATPSNVRWLEINLLQAGKASLGLSAAYFEKFVPLVTLLCDSVYMVNKDSIPLRSVFYDATCSLLRINLVSCKTAHQNLDVDAAVAAAVTDTSLFSGDLLSGFDFSYFADKLDLPLAEAMTADGLLGFSSSSSPSSMDSSSSATAEATPASSKDSHSTPQTPLEDQAPSPKKAEAEAPDCCELCGYRPKGDPKWFRGSMLKHRLTKHSEEVIIYKCNFPGCNSQYRNRPDNLKQHQVEKNHFVGDEATAKKPRKPKTKRTANGEIAASAAKKRKTDDQ